MPQNLESLAFTRLLLLNILLHAFHLATLDFPLHHLEVVKGNPLESRSLAARSSGVTVLLGADPRSSTTTNTPLLGIRLARGDLSQRGALMGRVQRRATDEDSGGAMLFLLRARLLHHQQPDHHIKGRRKGTRACAVWSEHLATQESRGI